MSEVNNKIPIEMDISISSAKEALQFWLTNQVFKEAVLIDKVRFVSDTHGGGTFNIKFKRDE